MCSSLDEEVDCHLGCAGDASRVSSGPQVDVCVGVEAMGDERQFAGAEYDGGEDFEWYSCVSNKVAYCQAATESHNAGARDGVAGGSEAVPTPFEGQGSAMYTYHESSKMRVGTLNVRGSLPGTSEVFAGILGWCEKCVRVLV